MITNTDINTDKKTQVDACYETSTFALAVGLSVASLVGLWGLVSLISALAGNGPANLITSYFTTVTGM